MRACLAFANTFSLPLPTQTLTYERKQNTHYHPEEFKKDPLTIFLHQHLNLPWSTETPIYKQNTHDHICNALVVLVTSNRWIFSFRYILELGACFNQYSPAPSCCVSYIIYMYHIYTIMSTFDSLINFSLPFPPISIQPAMRDRNKTGSCDISDIQLL